MLRRIWTVTLTVADLDKAVDFYERVLGLQKKYQFPDYAGFECGGVELGLRTWGGLEPPRQGEPCIDLLVDDLGKAYTTLKERGVRFTQAPRDAVWGARFVPFRDPDGNMLQLVQVKWGEYFAACAPR